VRVGKDVADAGEAGMDGSEQGAAGLWCWARGQQRASAILAGGSAFGATILVLLAVVAFLNATGDSGH
jgi:hypothetical protein